MKKILFLWLFICLNSFGSSDLVEKILLDNPVIVKNFESSHSFITIFDTSNLGSFVVKQKKVSDSIDWSVLWMTLSAQIASSIPDLLCQKVYLISKEQDFIGKIYNNKLAILLTQVPGEMLRSLKRLFKKVHIAQFRKGFLRGIDQDVIRSMSTHSDLARIVALDVFIGYYDRHRGNVFFDEKTDRFWAIDMDSMRKNLSKVACKNFKNFLKDETIIFSKEEILALIIFRDTLELLINQYSSKKMIKQMMKIAEEIGVKKKIYKTIVLLELLSCHGLIKKMCRDAKKLLVITDQLIKVKSGEYKYEI